jgi:hypothetical protein
MSEKRESSVAAQAKPESGIAQLFWHSPFPNPQSKCYDVGMGKVHLSLCGNLEVAMRYEHELRETHDELCPYRAERDAAIERACEEWQNLAANKHDELHQLRKANEALREGLRGAIQHMRHAPWCESFMSRHSLECDCGVPAAINALAALLAGDSEAERGD